MGNQLLLLEKNRIQLEYVNKKSLPAPAVKLTWLVLPSPGKVSYQRIRVAPQVKPEPKATMATS